MVEHQATARTHDLCTVAKIRSQLDAADLDRALTERFGGTYLLTGVVIAESLNKTLGERAHNIKGPTVQRHRRGLRGCKA